MSWQTSVTSEEVDTSSTGATPGYGTWQALGDRGKIYYQVFRDDASPVDDWAIWIEESADGVTPSAKPWAGPYKYPATDLSKGLVVGGPPYVRIKITNEESSPTEDVETTVKSLKSV